MASRIMDRLHVALGPQRAGLFHHPQKCVKRRDGLDVGGALEA